MVGRHAKQNELWSEPVNLTRRIPADHPLCKLRACVKRDFGAKRWRPPIGARATPGDRDKAE